MPAGRSRARGPESAAVDGLLEHGRILGLNCGSGMSPWLVSPWGVTGLTRVRTPATALGGAAGTTAVWQVVFDWLDEVSRSSAPCGPSCVSTAGRASPFRRYRAVAEVEIAWYVVCFELQDALVVGWPLVLTVPRASADATRGAVH
mgnify:FL=1